MSPSNICNTEKNSDKQEECDVFNKHFVAVGNFYKNSGLSAFDSVCDAPTISVSSRPCGFSLRPFSRHKLFNTLSGIGPEKSAQTDELDPHLYY